MTPEMDEEPQCAISVTDAVVLQTTALSARCPGYGDLLGFFVFPRKWVGMNKEKPGTACFFGARFLKEEGWQYFVDRVFGLNSRTVVATPPPRWKRQGSCSLVELVTRVHENLEGDQTTDAKRVVFVTMGEDEDLPWVATLGYAISETHEGPNDAEEERHDTGKWYRVGGKRVFVRTSRIRESGGAAIGHPYVRTDTDVSYLLLGKRRCSLKELHDDEVARLRKLPGGIRLPPPPVRREEDDD